MITNPTNEHAQELVRDWLISEGAALTGVYGEVSRERVARFKSALESRIASALSSRDAEVREVLEGFRPREDRYAGGWCWCYKDLTNDRQPHSKHCETVNALYAKLQPGKKGSDVD